MQATTVKPELIPTLYPPSLVKNAVVKRKIAALNTNVREHESHEDIHKLHSRLFKKTGAPEVTAIITTSTPPKLLVFKKPTQMESEVASKLTELTKYLPTSAKDELKMLREIPDLEEISNSGADQGAGGTFGPEETSPKLVDFGKGNGD
ncbi:unnamed protein product [Strongylus vulgaris]|uniref:Uncharacterized protein n=1 Tax=Strongylus vulgaris TaxID=40348 RepID=A0A3P7LQP2_STRVU|nr:unnamed protein product [Strongylus vulgaris]